MESEQFYEIKIKPNEVLVRIRPPDGGKRANLNEIQKKLGELDVSYRMEHLFDIYRRANDEFETLAKRESAHYEINMEVSDDGHEAFMTVIPPQIGDEKLSPDKFKTALESKGVEKGILYNEIKRLMADKVEGERVLIAKGQRAIQGVDGWIEFNPENEQDTKVSVEDNRADYREMNLIKSIDEGHLIAKVFPPTRGANGFNVKGKVIKGANGKRARYRLGANVTINEDGTEIFAGKSGFVVFAGEKITVEDVLELPNVDSETGNIRFTGVVRVKGQVEDGFTVEGGQGIEVFGTVGKALLKSRGDIRVMGGMFGTKIKSGNSVFAKFLSDCQVSAGKHVVAEEYILHSNVQAGKIVQVTRIPKGFITGGLVRAGESVWSPSIGSEASEEKTRIEVGVELNLRREFDELRQRLARNREKFDKVRKNIRVLQSHWETKGKLPAEHQPEFEKMIKLGHGLRNALLESAEEHHRLYTALASQSDGEGFVFAAIGANSGTSIQIKRHRFQVNSTLESCAFRIQDDELKVASYGDVQRLYKLTHPKLPA